MKYIFWGIVLVVFISNAPTDAIPADARSAISHHLSGKLAIGKPQSPGVGPSENIRPQPESVDSHVVASPTTSASGSPFPISGDTFPTIDKLKHIQKSGKADSIALTASKTQSASGDAFSATKYPRTNEFLATSRSEAATPTTSASGIAFLRRDEALERVQTKDFSVPPAASFSVDAAGNAYLNPESLQLLELPKQGSLNPAATAVLSAAGSKFADLLQVQAEDASSNKFHDTNPEVWNGWQFVPVSFQGTANSANILAACRFFRLPLLLLFACHPGLRSDLFSPHAGLLSFKLLAIIQATT
jgi:hypothetical protein